MKKAIITLTILTYYLVVFGQDTEIKQISNTNKIFNRAEFIFEGTIIERKSYKAGVSIYTSNIFQITKIYRGEKQIKRGTIEIVTEGGSVGETLETFEAQITEDGGVGTQKVENGLYFCVRSKFSPSDIAADNTIRLTPIAVISTYDLWGFGRKFKNRKELYDFMMQYENITIPEDSKDDLPEKEEDKQPETKPDKKKEISGSSDAEKAENKLKYEQRVRNYNTYMEQRMKMIQDRENKKE